MTLDEFRASLSRPAPPEGCSAPLIALWHDGRGDWEQAHNVAQEIDDEDGAWVHAYLHRKEGDSGNARHWYRRACRKFASETLIEEWERIAEALLVPATDTARMAAEDMA